MGMTFVNKMPAPIHADGRATYQSSSTGEIGSKQPCTGASTKRFLDSTLMSLLRVAPSANKAVSRCTVPSVSDGFSVTDSRLSTTILKAISCHVIEFAKSRQYGNTAIRQYGKSVFVDVSHSIPKLRGVCPPNPNCSNSMTIYIIDLYPSGAIAGPE